MQRAGGSVARLALALAPHARCVWVAAGPGNNGGDGLEAARYLRETGFEVHVTLAGDAQKLPPDAQAAFARAVAAGIPVHGTDVSPPSLGTQDIAIDALLGLGIGRAPQGAIATLINHFDTLPCCVLAVDLPSGLNADTGQPAGTSCVKASHTLALLTAKPGLFTAAGRDHAGRVWFDGLGVDASNTPPDAWLSGPPRTHTPARRHAQHKGSFGDVVVIGGAPGMTGAAVLAARAAHAAGAGRVYLSLVGQQPLGHDLSRPELMWRQDVWKSDPALLKRATVVCGCGGGDAVRRALPPLLSAVPRLVLDADALNAIAVDTDLQRLLFTRGARGLATVMTPHPLEAARLLQTNTTAIQSDRLGAARQLADRFNCVVVLKGSGSVIAAPAFTPTINPTGNAALATAGTGDVLAGWLGGRWSTSGPASPNSNIHDAAFNASNAAVWAHGRAADDANANPLRAADLVEMLHQGASTA